jgi:tRNA threonylcarbamoyladenosine biosynthesis protein TsaE
LSWTYDLADEAATERLGRWLGETARRGDALLLGGDLGAGKTTLARGLARGLGIDVPVTSPTFTLVNEYEGRLRLFHFDLYRLGGGEIEATGLHEYWDEPRGVCAIEWPERLDDGAARLAPEAALAVRLAPTPSGGRVATFTSDHGRPAAWLDEVKNRAAGA